MKIMDKDTLEAGPPIPAEHGTAGGVVATGITVAAFNPEHLIEIIIGTVVIAAVAFFLIRLIKGKQNV